MYSGLLWSKMTQTINDLLYYLCEQTKNQGDDSDMLKGLKKTVILSFLPVKNDQPKEMNGKYKK